MSARIKRTVIVFMLGFITLPFILVTDLFPFMRFGMFAEPVRHQVQTEHFDIILTENDGNKQLLKPEQIGIEDHFYQYLIRNYFYRGEGDILLKKIEKLLSFPADKLELKRYPSEGQAPDSTITHPVK